MLSGAGIGTAVAAYAAQPDAELIALCAIVVDGHAELNRYSDLYDGNDPPHVEARIRVLVDEGHRISQQVADMRAASWATSGARPAAAAWWHRPQPGCREHDPRRGLLRDGPYPGV